MSEDSWHLSKSVPITLIIGLITQGAAIVWVVSMMYGDIERNTNKLSDLGKRLDKLEDMVFTQAIAMARIDENIKAIRDDVHKMATREID
jgi:septal ring factor EnvC (AmiA/AmiB activator)